MLRISSCDDGVLSLDPNGNGKDIRYGSINNMYLLLQFCKFHSLPWCNELKSAYETSPLTLTTMSYIRPFTDVITHRSSIHRYFSIIFRPDLICSKFSYKNKLISALHSVIRVYKNVSHKTHVNSSE